MNRRLTTKSAPGQAVILVALALVLLVAMAGLGIDGANAFNKRRNASNAADAAAMAGANALIQELNKSTPGANSIVYSAVSTYLNKHGIDPTDPSNPWTAYYTNSSGTRGNAVTNDSSQVDTTARGIAVDVRNTFGTWFMPVLGQSTLTVGGTATAIFGKHRLEGGDILPITMSKDAANDMKGNPGTSFVFGPDSGAFKVNSGNFGAISLNPNENDANNTGSNSSCSSSTPQDNPRYWWCNGSQYDIQAGDSLYGDPGELSSNVRSEVQYRIATNPIGIVPIYDTTNDAGGNGTKFRIVGFLTVELVSEHLTGNPKTITAKYVKYSASSGAIDPNSPVTGQWAINLIK
jgi:Flp pilus assembly protein TadG